MSSTRSTLLIALASFTFFTGCIAFTTSADQNKNFAKSLQLSQQPVNKPNTQETDDAFPAVPPKSLLAATPGPAATDGPVSANHAPSPPVAAPIAPALPQASPQLPPTRLSPAASAQPALPAPAAMPKTKTTKTRAS